MPALENRESTHARSSRLDVGGMGIDPVSTNQVHSIVRAGWLDGVGGIIVTPNVDIWRLVRNEPGLRQIVDDADIVVADGAPLLWASTLAGRALPERVTGSGLVESLSGVAAQSGKSIYLIGGGTGGAVDRAADALMSRHPGLVVSGTQEPPFGFEQNPELERELVEQVVAAQPDLVLVGLGFPRQERLALKIRGRLSSAWLLGCGAGIEMAAGDARRAPMWAQRAGLEWMLRLVQNPRRLAGRYLVHDAPAAVALLHASAKVRWRNR
jgi:N-acetylglucosaminyldiphosphoundecaprenol N-acetyl-beta-D-mannosaminyltransferase